MTYYEILTGKLPFEGHPQTGYDFVINGQHSVVSEYVEEWTRELCDVIPILSKAAVFQQVSSCIHWTLLCCCRSYSVIDCLCEVLVSFLHSATMPSLPP